MPLIRIADPFDNPDWIFELKWDGFRALAFIEDGRCRLVSRNGHEFRQWDALKAEIAGSIRADRAILDGELVCPEDDGRPNFYKLLFRRATPCFYVFDLLEIGGCDLRGLPLLRRKRRLKGILPHADSRLRYVDHVATRGSELYRLACEHDLEGIVGKWNRGTYQQGPGTSWLKIKNPTYSQMEGRHELFDGRGAVRARLNRQLVLA